MSSPMTRVPVRYIPPTFRTGRFQWLSGPWGQCSQTCNPNMTDPFAISSGDLSERWRPVECVDKADNTVQNE